MSHCCKYLAKLWNSVTRHMSRLSSHWVLSPELPFAHFASATLSIGDASVFPDPPPGPYPPMCHTPPNSNPPASADISSQGENTEGYYRHTFTNLSNLRRRWDFKSKERIRVQEGLPSSLFMRGGSVLESLTGSSWHAPGRNSLPVFLAVPPAALIYSSA